MQAGTLETYADYPGSWTRRELLIDRHAGDDTESQRAQANNLKLALVAAHRFALLLGSCE